MTRKRSALGIVVLLAGCSDTRAATEKNFEVAINRVLATERACFTLGRLPHVVRGDGAERAAYDALVKHGFLVAREEVQPARSGFGASWSREPRLVRVYEATEAGARVIRNAVGMDRARLCSEEVPVLEQVEQFSEPADRQGFVASLVTYTYRVGVPGWAKDVQLSHFEQVPAGWVNGAVLRDRATVVLTNNGWVHERDLEGAGRAAFASGRGVPVTPYVEPDAGAAAKAAPPSSPVDTSEVPEGGPPTDVRPAVAIDRAAAIAEGPGNVTSPSAAPDKARAASRLARPRRGSAASVAPPPEPSESTRVAERPARWITPDGREVIAAPPP